jgi:hypothetical protein
LDTVVSAVVDVVAGVGQGDEVAVALDAVDDATSLAQSRLNSSSLSPRKPCTSVASSCGA